MVRGRSESASGLHVGSAVTGNVGSPRRKEFTAIGDTSISFHAWNS